MQLFGKNLKTISSNGLTLTETVYMPYCELPAHSHDFAYFCFVLKGGFTEKYGRQSRLCTASTLIFHPRNETHSDSFFRVGGRCFNVKMESAMTDRLAEHSMKLNAPISLHTVSLSRFAAKIYREFHDPDEISALAFEGLFLEMTAEAFRQSGKAPDKQKPRWLESVREILHARFHEALSLSEIASLVGRHPVHLAREFRKHFRCTIGEYVRRLRVDFALRKLSSSDYSLSEIAFDAGFSHQSHFSKTFKLLIGQTPSEYRETSRLR